MIDSQDVCWLQSIVQLLETSDTHYLVVGTHIDEVINDLESITDEKAPMIADWRDYIQNILKIKDAADIFCIENYPCHSPFQNRESINYYALSLL